MKLEVQVKYSFPIGNPDLRLTRLTALQCQTQKTKILVVEPAPHPCRLNDEMTSLRDIYSKGRIEGDSILAVTSRRFPFADSYRCHEKHWEPFCSIQTSKN
jgi:hypothetical protein